MNALHALLALPLVACASTSSTTHRAIQDAAPISEVFQRVQRAVVTLRTVSEAPVADTAGQVVSEEGVGSGTIIDREGRILTAAHVVQTADKVVVELYDGTELAARVISSDPLSDVALVQLTEPLPERVQVAQLGDSDLAHIGSEVFVVGAPLGISHTLTVGHFSARRKAPSMFGGGALLEVIQTDAAINPGNSGGPLFDRSGRVLGVVSYIATVSGGSQGLGFAISAATVRERLLDRPQLWSGMSYLYLTGRLAEVFQIPDDRVGLLVQRVAKNSPAARIGIRGGDIAATIAGVDLLLGGDVIMTVQGKPLAGPGDDVRIRGEIDLLGPEDEVEIAVMRGGELETLKIERGKLQ